MLNPATLSAFVLNPATLSAFVLNPATLSAFVLNPATLSAFVLNPQGASRSSVESATVRIAIYALGPGHECAMRGMALARSLQDQSGAPGTAVHCLLLVTESLKERARLARVPAACPPPMAHREADMLLDWVRRSLRDFKPDVLVVDTWPLGMLGELGQDLEQLAAVRLLVSPWVNPQYYLRPDIAHAITTRYHGWLVCEPLHETLNPLAERCTRVERIPPLLLVRPQDVQASTTGRQTFGVHEMERVVLGLGDGDAASERSLLDAMVAASRQPGMRFSVLFLAQHLPSTISPGVRVTSVFPAGAWLRTCPVAVTSAGYASYYEVVQANVPVVFRPQPRPLDHQRGRARGELGLVPFAPHSMIDDDGQLGAAIRPLLERELRRRYGHRGSLADDVEGRAPSTVAGNTPAEALMRLVGSQGPDEG